MNTLIEWFVRNPIASNLLMLFIVVGGITGLGAVSKTVYPSAALDTVTINVPFRGASPADVEERVLIPVEEAISGLQGIKRIRANGNEGSGTVIVEAIEGYDVDQLLNEIKARVDAINTFPAQSDRPVVSRSYVQNQVMFLLLHGPLDEFALKELGRDIRDRIAALPQAEKTRLEGARDYEISVEVSELQLEKFGLTFDDVVQAIRRSSLNVGAGTIDDPSGQTQLLTRGQAYQESDFHDIVVARQGDGNQILLRDVATVVDGFADGAVSFRYNNAPTLLLTVIASENPDVVALSRRVHELLDQEIRPNLPAGVGIESLIDESDSFRDRLQLLTSNGISGLLLVFVALALFLTPRLALWVCLGICISFLGCFWLMPYLGVQLSMISTFALVLILGIVVDDALIISESIHRQNEKGLLGAEGSIAGTVMVARPVLFSALTTMLAFSPLLFIEGAVRNFVIAIPLVVIVTLVFSLLESFCILPLHLLAKSQAAAPANAFTLGITRLRNAANRMLQHVIHRLYRPFLDRVLRNKGLALSSFLALCFFILSFSLGGWLKFSFNPNVVADFIQVNLQFPAGLPYSVKLDAQTRLEGAANTLQEQMLQEYPDREIIKGTVTWTFTQSNRVQAFMTISAAESRAVGVDELARRWRELAGPLPDVTDSSFAFTVNDSQPVLNLVVAGNDQEQMQHAAAALRQKLLSYQGVYEVVQGNDSATTEAELSLLPGAENLGISLNDLATQVRQAFYGEEVQRIPRGRDAVRVMVRLPQVDRETFATLDSLRIRTASGTTVPFAMVAAVEFRQGSTQLSRTDRERTVLLTAKVDPAEGNVSEIQQDLAKGYLRTLSNQYPGVTLRWTGNQEDESTFMDSILRNAMFAMLGVYFLLAVAFRSYVQPLLIMVTIPCGYLGAVVGHLLLGLDMSLYSILGIVAAAGVVVNDNLVLMDYINKLRGEGLSALVAVEKAAEDRFRPIFLTSLTTFVGLVPLMSETSIQAQFMIPTVVSLAFGVLFATLVTLLLVPVLYLQLVEFQDWLKGLWQRGRAAPLTV
jgi:multidrug efflux pump subunit AcrB